MKGKPSFLLIMPCIRSTKYRERIELACWTKNSSYEMPPCSFYERNNRKCFVSEESTCCGECIHRGTHCDRDGPSVGDWSSLEREEERLCEVKALALQAVSENAARAQRADKQLEFLRAKGKEMLRRGLQTLDELDGAEEREQQERETAKQVSREVATTAPNGSFDPFVLNPKLVLD